jgi:hypothetical protein
VEIITAPVAAHSSVAGGRCLVLRQAALLEKTEKMRRFESCGMETESS